LWTDALGHARGVVALEIADDDLRAHAGRGGRGGGPDAAAATGDEDDATL
jgi:hypothetical protein